MPLSEDIWTIGEFTGVLSVFLDKAVHSSAEELALIELEANVPTETIYDAGTLQFVILEVSYLVGGRPFQRDIYNCSHSASVSLLTDLARVTKEITANYHRVDLRERPLITVFAQCLRCIDLVCIGIDISKTLFLELGQRFIYVECKELDRHDNCYLGFIAGLYWDF